MEMGEATIIYSVTNTDTHKQRKQKKKKKKGKKKLNKSQGPSI